jgi:hypothetical protein
MMSYAPSLKVKAEAELELRRRQRVKQIGLRALPLADFAARTRIEVPNDAGAEVAHVPFVLWPAQAEALTTMERERLIAFLKSRQVGLSWLACLYAMRRCALYPGYPVLCLSRSQDDADELVHRMSFMYHQHQDRAWFSRLIKDNTADLAWANGSSVVSLAATKNAGRGFTGALVLLDEWAFMQWPRETLAAVKPTIDAGGKLFIISSADGQGSAYHQFWQHSLSGTNGYTPVFLPWFARPDRGSNWRDQKLTESGGDTATIYREYPANDLEAFTAATDLVYDIWSDGPDDGNVTEAAEYVPDGGPVYYAIDDGYEGTFDPKVGHYTATSSPRVFLLIQEKSGGHLDVFYESYAVKKLSDDHIAEVQALPYPVPTYAAVDSAAAELRGRLHLAGVYTQGKPHRIDESVKATRRMLAPDLNGVRRIRVHPRCVQLRYELASYRNGPDGVPIDALNHGPDALRYLAWTRRHEV